MTAPAAEPAGGSVRVGTEYVVLQLDPPDDGRIWRNVGKVAARSAEHAVKQYAEKEAGSTALVLVAVPAKSWQPLRVTVKQETRLEVSQA